MQTDWQKAKQFLKKDGIGVLPTDTIYGVVGSALSKKAVSKIYKVKNRGKGKPFIILINSIKQLEIFGVSTGEKEAKFLAKIWPGKVSVILPCTEKKYAYLHRNTNSLAFRMVGKRNRNLFHLIEGVGPIVAPSANKEGASPASTITEAKKYFSNEVDFYIEAGTKKSKPSTLIQIKNNKVIILRQGLVKIPD